MPYLELRGINKSYSGGVRANADVSLAVERGEIHGLIGENGAGKSTLMKILYGMEQPDSGEIWLDSRRVTIHNPPAAIKLGIGMVHQHFQLVPNLTVAENIALGHEPRRGLFADQAAMRQRVGELAARFGLHVDPAARVGDLSVGLQQRVEILKMLYRDARLLILDEPSAVLTPQEVVSLFTVLRQLVAGGCTAIFITHKLDEVAEICDRATVLRRGQVVGTVETARSSPAEIARMMVGYDIERVTIDDTSGQSEQTERDRLVLRDVAIAGVKQTTVSLTVRAGEILGIAGVEGNGQKQLVEALIGLSTVKGGEILVDGAPIHHLNARRRRECGLALIPEDRNLEGLSKPLMIWENLFSGDYYRPPASDRGLLRVNRLRERARDLVERFDIRAPGENIAVGALSGGNAQKVVIARELAAEPAVLIAAQPTRGLDIGAAAFVHEQLLNLRAHGVAVLLISADLDELLALSDRIAVMFEGSVLRTFARAEATREQVGLAMAGKVESERSR